MTDKDKAQELKEILQGKHVGGPAPKEKKEPKEEKKSEEDVVSSEEWMALKKELEESKDRLLRNAAEFENYKKRGQREKEEWVKYGNERVFMELIQVLDDFDRVLDHMPPKPSDELKQFAEGVEITRRHFWKVLLQFGLKEVESTQKPFDPNLHEAMAHVEVEGVPSGNVVDQHRKGYLFHDRLLRAALVTVAK